jgi:hypothetical protein
VEEKCLLCIEMHLRFAVTAMESGIAKDLNVRNKATDTTSGVKQNYFASVGKGRNGKHKLGGK